MTRRSFDDVQRETIVAERAGVLALARKHAAQVQALVARGRMPAAEATELTQRIHAFADQVAQGLHRDEADPAGVRAALRVLVTGEGA